MLDDLKLIHERDAQDTLGIIAKQWQQLEYDVSLSGNTTFSKINNVVYAAMGGSAIAGMMLLSLQKLTVPLEIVKEYDLPAYVGSDTLVVLSSYSGNTEEALSALEQAEARGAQVAIITAGGALQKIAEEKNYLFAELPQTSFARSGVLANFKATLEVVTAAGLLSSEDIEPVLKKAAEHIKEAAKAWAPDVATAKNPAKKLAQELLGKSVVVYAGPKMFPAAYKWKLGFNENAKQVAWVNQYPELNHNEFTGWSKQPVDKPYAVIELRSELEHSRVQKRFEVTERLLSGMRPQPHVVQAEGADVCEQLAWLMVLGDFVGVYLAILNGLNPMPLELVDKLKQALTSDMLG
jgi:glucose/mannose-6-phosphate isomerase